MLFVLVTLLAASGLMAQSASQRRDEAQRLLDQKKKGEELAESGGLISTRRGTERNYYITIYNNNSYTVDVWCALDGQRSNWRLGPGESVPLFSNQVSPDFVFIDVRRH